MSQRYDRVPTTPRGPRASNAPGTSRKPSKGKLHTLGRNKSSEEEAIGLVQTQVPRPRGARAFPTFRDDPGSANAYESTDDEMADPEMYHETGQTLEGDHLEYDESPNNKAGTVPRSGGMRAYEARDFDTPIRPVGNHGNMSHQRQSFAEATPIRSTMSTPVSIAGKTSPPSAVSHKPSAQYMRPVSSNPPAPRGMVLLHPMQAEPDDYLHMPDKYAKMRSMRPTLRGCLNVATLTLIALAVIMLFIGYPLIANYDNEYNKMQYKLDQLNAKAQPIPRLNLIDEDTDPKYHKWKNPAGETWDLVFSDEFEKEGRTFWPGEDPFWEAVDIYYAATNDYEWYSPEAIVTKNGKLVITLEQMIEHNTYFRSGMLQSWNKFCFQGGYIEAAVVLPGNPDTQAYWPGFWLLGNLGRPGYTATTEGLWPYAYESCDVGILEYQQYENRTGPHAALHEPKGEHGNISSLPGMRYSSCTCPGSDHPGPNVKTARMVPEIDVFEVQVQAKEGESRASQSYQVAPFDKHYKWYNNRTSYHIYDDDVTERNPWSGGQYQEALSCTTRVPDKAFEKTDNVFTIFGLEYDPDFDGKGTGYVTWYVDGKPTWTLYDGALNPDPDTKVGKRIFPKEPMSIIINLGISSGFQHVNWREAIFPAHMLFDYIRVYQSPGKRRVTCDPKDYPTSDFINRHKDVYMNANLTTWMNGSGTTWPKNKHLGCD